MNIDPNERIKSPQDWLFFRRTTDRSFPHHKGTVISNMFSWRHCNWWNIMYILYKLLITTMAEQLHAWLYPPCDIICIYSTTKAHYIHRKNLIKYPWKTQRRRHLAWDTYCNVLMNMYITQCCRSYRSRNNAILLRSESISSCRFDIKI